MGLSAAAGSRHFALVFSQKICAVTLPAFAAPNKELEIVALASVTPRSSSSRATLAQRFRGATDDLGDVVLRDTETGQVPHLLAQRISHDKSCSRHVLLLINRGPALRRARRRTDRRLDVSRRGR